MPKGMPVLHRGNFNPRASQRPRPKVRRVSRFPGRISTLEPRRGLDDCFGYLRPKGGIFQPSSLAEASTESLRLMPASLVISTLEPRRGLDVTQKEEPVIEKEFQPSSLAEASTTANCISTITREFQPSSLAEASTRSEE